ncbi:MAG: cysteine peptidase family C39 domain-containing protein [Patescibacteria group bacterium]
MKQLDFPKFMQTYEYDCGTKALQAVLIYYGIEIREELLIKYAKTNKKEGTLIKGILRTLKKYKLKFNDGQLSIKDLKDNIDKKIPTILLLQAWNPKKIDYTNSYRDGHWVVAVGYTKDKIIFEDPYFSICTFLTNKELEKRWHGQEKVKQIKNYGIVVYGKNPTYDSKKIIHMD